METACFDLVLLWLKRGALPYPLTCQWGMCSTHSTHTSSHSLLNSRFLSLENSKISWKSGKLHIMRWKHLIQTGMKAFKSFLIGTWVSSCHCFLFLLLSPHPFTSFSFFTQPKSFYPHWWFFSMSCPFPWIFDTCWRSKRGLFSFSSYLRDLSLPHFTPFILVMLCY